MSRPESEPSACCWGRSKPEEKRRGTKNTGKDMGFKPSNRPKDTQPKAEMDRVTRSLFLHLCCPVCDTYLLHPVSLPCGHCLCKVCLETIQRKATSTKTCEEQPCSVCPRCQAPYSPQPGGAWLFPENTLLAHTALKLLEDNPGLSKLKQPKTTRSKKATLRVTTCEICPKQREAQHYCRTCGVNYCTKCLRKLHGNRAFQAHVLTEQMDGDRREPCPAHLERSLSHCCLDDEGLGCQGCMEQGHLGHDVTAIHDARARREVSLRSALEHAGKVKAQCEADMVAMEQLRARAGSDGAEMRRRVRECFLSLRNALLDHESALLAHLDGLTSSTRGGARDFLQDSAPLMASLTGLEVISEQALLEPDKVVFLSGAKALTQWLHRIKEGIRRPAPYLQEGEPFKAVKMDFDALLNDLQSILGAHLRWKSIETAGVAIVPNFDCILERCDVVHVTSCPGSPVKGQIPVEPPLPLTPRKKWEEQLMLPAGDSSPREDKDQLLLPRPPIIYQHHVMGATVEIFWMVPMGEEVDSFDIHFQDAATVGMAEGKGVVLCGLEACNLQTAGLRPDTHYLYRARSVNSHGIGEWSSSYRVNTKHQGDEAKAHMTQEV